jgi:hypothetical protein
MLFIVFPEVMFKRQRYFNKGSKLVCVVQLFIFQAIKIPLETTMIKEGVCLVGVQLSKVNVFEITVATLETLGCK